MILKSSALAMSSQRCGISHKTTVNPNGGVCCNDDPPQLYKINLTNIYYTSNIVDYSTQEYKKCV